MKSSFRHRFLPGLSLGGFIAGVWALLCWNALEPLPTKPAQAVLKIPAPMAKVPPPPPLSTWKPATAKQSKQAQSSIVTQLEAFKKDDYQRASQYQSTNLRRNFPTVDQFRRMMQVTYPQFARYKKVVFGKALASPDGIRVRVPVRLWGRDGIETQAIYTMLWEQGVFRVEGVGGGMAAPGEVQAA